MFLQATQSADTRDWIRFASRVLYAWFASAMKYCTYATAPAEVLALAGSGTPVAVVAKPEDVEAVDVVGVELDETAVADDDSTGDDVVQAEAMVASPRTTATPTQLNPRATPHPLKHP